MRGSRIALLAIAVVSVGVLALVASSDGVRYAERWPSLPWEGSDLDIAPTPADEELEPVQAESVSERDEDVSQAAADVFGIILVALAVLGIITLVNRRQGAAVRWRRPRQSREFSILRDRLDEISSAVDDDAVAQRELLLAGEPRNAIVECWQRLESLLIDVGVDRQVSDTSTDLVTRTLGRTDVDASALASFAELYREARFSAHPMGESDRRAALAALDSLHDSLRARHSTGSISMR